MQVRPVLRKLGLVAAIAAALLAAPAGASAKQLGAHVNYEASLWGPGQLVVAYQCQGQAAYVVASVSVRCGVNKMGGLALPGNYVLYNEGEVISNAPFSVCWVATATFFDGSTLTTNGCTPKTIALFGSGSSYVEGGPGR
jgi:hypothetical protein